MIKHMIAGMREEWSAEFTGGGWFIVPDERSYANSDTLFHLVFRRVSEPWEVTDD